MSPARPDQGTTRRNIAGLFALACLLGWIVAGSGSASSSRAAATPVPPAAEGAGCRFLVAAHRVEFSTVPEGTPQKAEAPKKRGAIADEDVQRLLSSLKIVPFEKGEGTAARLVVEPGSMSSDDVEDLLSQVATLLADLDAESMLNRIQKDPKLRKQVSQEVIDAFHAVRSCAALGFADRGGDAAYKSSRRAVQAHKAELAGLMAQVAGAAPEKKP